MRRPSPSLFLPAFALGLALAVTTARAEPTTPASDLAVTDAGALALPSPAVISAVVPDLEYVHYVPAHRRGYTARAVWYQPRRYHGDPPPPSSPRPASSSNPMHSALDIYGGAYALTGKDNPTSSDFGFRGGPLIGDNVQMGLAFDWMYRHDSQRTLTGNPYEAAGSTITPERVLAQSSSHLFPMSAYLQLRLPMGPISPYGGVGGGYEILYLYAQDYETGQNFNATFGGWGWQTWAGVKIPLGSTVRLNGELFLNESIVQRDVMDVNGIPYVERVDVSGGGARAGLSFVF